MTEEILIKVELDKPEAEKQVNELSKSITNLTTENKNLIATNKELEKQGKANSKEYLENTKQIEINKQKINENNSSRKNLIQAIIAEDNSIKGLQIRNRELVQQRNLISTATEEGRAAIQKINAEIDKNNATIKENVSALEEQKLNVGNYTESIKQAASQIQVGGVSVGDLTGKLTSLLNPVTAGIAGFTALVGILTRGRQAQELFAQASAATSGVLDKLTKDTTELVETLAKQTKEGDNYFKVALKTNPIYIQLASSLKVLDAVTGGYISSLREAGEAAANFEARLQKIRILNLTNTQTSKELLKEEEKLRQIRDDDTRSFPERIAANEKILELEERRRRLLVSNVVKELEIVQSQIDNIGRQNASLDLLQREADLLNERADIIEDSTGKESEALTNRNSLQREYNALLEETKQKKLDELAAQEEAVRAEEDALIEQLNKEIEQIEEFENLKNETFRQIEDSFRAEQKQKEDQRLAESLAAQKRYTDAVTALKRTEAQEAIRLSSILQGLFRSDNAVSKTFGLLQIGINSAVGVSNAVKAGSGIPWPGNLAAILSGISAVLAGIGQAKSLLTGFATGGYLRSSMGIPIKRSNGDDRLITAKVGETILTPEQTARVGTSRLAAAGVPGFATGGIVGNETRIAAGQAESQFDINRLAGLINGIQPVLVYQDFEIAQDNILGTRNRAQVI